ncbi:MAG: ComEC/Rec2 family competence protein [Proteobacteria bacterium]|nr:ComEC/Rec2 family competence protein [Pseudomonadota bacterium]
MLAGPWAGNAPLAVALPLVLLLWSVLWVGAFLAGMDCRRSTGWPVVGLLLVSATVTAAVAWDRLAQRWPQRSSGERVLAMVTVDSLPATQGGTLGFEAEVQVVAPRSLRRSLRLQVTWRDAPRPMPRVGERWWLVLRVDALPVVRNPGGFDVSRAALRSDIDGRATVVTVGSNRRIYAAGRGLDPLRERIEGAIRDTVEDRDAAALFAGLAVGATGTMTREQWQVFAATGTTHLVAISGMHVTLFAWLAAGAARRLWSLGAARARRRAPPIGREPFAAVIGTTAALGYALLAGFGIPTQRTVVMLAVWWLMRLGGRERSGFEVLGWALLAVLALDPLAPLSSGFWLSFGAMAVLLAGDLEKGGVTPGAVRALLVTQWRVGIALAPLTLAWFGSVSLAGFVVNLFAIPVISFLLVPLVLAGMALPIAWRAAEWLHALGWPLLQASADWPWAMLDLDPDPWSIVLLACLLPLWLLPVPLRWRLAGLGALLPWAMSAAGWLPRSDLPTKGAAQVILFDAGDGFALLVRTRHHALLVDTAASQAARAAAAQSPVVAGLRASGVRRLDMLVLSLAHGVRAAGAAQVLAAVEVRAARVGGGWPGAPSPLLPCGAVERWSWDDVDFELRQAAPQEGSCVLRIAIRGGPALLIAERVDAEEGAALLAAGATLAAEVVVAPRRGSPAAIAPGFTQSVVAAREITPAKRALVAQTWRVPEARVHATAGRGALALQLQPGLPPRLLRHAGGWMAEPPPGSPLGYHP